mmetsp:Transcript_68709/g.191663  ORF Transcript_68709/g.191663 Transcript_68709/m.191663 type:complete len:309 (+) Transcript_68709:263-1189(+)
MIKGSEHVGELQLHLRTIVDIKEAAHRTYALMRSVGWQDDSLEEDSEDPDSEEDEVVSAHINPMLAGATPGDIEMAVVATGDEGGSLALGTAEDQRRAKQEAAKLEWELKFGGRESLVQTGGRRSSFSVASLGAFTNDAEIGAPSLRGGGGGGACVRANRRSSLSFSWKPSVDLSVEGFNARTVPPVDGEGGGGGGAVAEVNVEAVEVGEEVGGGSWTEHTSDDGRAYYHNTATNETKWADEPASPWTEMTADDGQTYYHNTVTDETSWTRPATGATGATGASQVNVFSTPSSMVTWDQEEVGQSSGI